MLFLLGGCSSSRDADVEQLAERFHAALAKEDGSAACDLLSEAAQEELGSEGDSCEVAVLDSGVPDNGRVERVEVFDTSAQVRYDQDVIFLSDFPDGWKIIGAGCTRVAEKPYDCEIHGG